MLELLSSFQSIWVTDYAAVNLCDIGETIHNEGADQNGVRDFVIFKGKAVQGS